MMMLSIACALSLVSQSASGDGTVHTNAGGKDQEMQMHMEVAADFDEIAFGQRTEMVSTQSIGSMTIATHTNTTMVMAVKDGSMAMVNHVVSEAAVTGQPPQKHETCAKFELHDAKAPAAIHACIQKLADTLRPAESKDGLDEYVETMEMAGSTQRSAVKVDQQGLVHELSSETDVKVPGGQTEDATTVTTSFSIPLESTAGAPDMSRFSVDPAVQCTESGMPQPPPGAGASMIAFYKCFAETMQAAAAQSLVV